MDPTPGPWSVTHFADLSEAHENNAFLWADEWPAEAGRPSEVWRGAEGGGITGLPGSVEVGEANALLIAAAPDLLAHLELLTTWMRRADVTHTVGAVGELLRAAEGAVRKAKGEAP